MHQPKGSTGLIRIQRIDNDKLRLAKSFRRHMTYAERCFWDIVRRNRVNGLRFRRQQLVHGFIADFYCNQIGLVVEIDGGIHEQQRDHDRLRDAIIRSQGVRVIRFSNKEVIHHAGSVRERIMAALRDR